MTQREWFSFQAGPLVVLGDTPHEQFWFQDTAVGGFRVNEGDTASHFLLDYWWTTALYENSLELQLAPWPLVVGASWVPETGDASSWNPNGDQGDALVTAGATWEPHAWTDGTTQSTRWVARSTQPLYSNTSRTIRDLGTDSIRLGAGMQHPFDFSGSSELWFLPDIWGWVRLRFVITEKQV